jgi:hypothetical protein
MTLIEHLSTKYESVLGITLRDVIAFYLGRKISPIEFQRRMRERIADAEAKGKTEKAAKMTQELQKSFDKHGEWRMVNPPKF